MTPETLVILSSLLTGVVSSGVTHIANKIEIRHLWKAVARHEREHVIIWKELAKLRES